MAEQEVVSGLRKRWSALRDDLVFLPHLNRLMVETQESGHEVVEFVRVAPVDEDVMLPVAPDVSAEDVRDYPGWSGAEEDQQRMWALVGTAIEGNKVTRACPHCGGSTRVTCSRCHGRGRVDCSWCTGSGHRSCTSCGGSGSRSVTKTTTNADGSTSTTTESESCTSCGGRGRDTCTSCLGSGRVTCDTCGGSGDVRCGTCSPAGTVDFFVRRSFAASTVKTQILPVSLPGYPEPIRLTKEHVQIHPRDAATPLDAVADLGALAKRAITAPDSRLFFIRKATTTVHSVREARTGELCATFIDGEPEPILTVHRTIEDPEWTPDREGRRAFASSVLYALGPVALVGFLVRQQLLIGAGVAAVFLIAAYLLHRHPVRAFRNAFLKVRCPRHDRTATMRCAGCGKDLCHECLLPSPRCPLCGQSASLKVTHLLEDGKWVEAHPTQHG